MGDRLVKLASHGRTNTACFHLHGASKSDSWKQGGTVVATNRGRGRGELLINRDKVSITQDECILEVHPTIPCL